MDSPLQTVVFATTPSSPNYTVPITSTEIHVTAPTQSLGPTAPGTHFAAASDPASAGWLAALATAIHVMKGAGRTHEMEKLTEILEYHATPATPKSVAATIVIEVDNGVINCARSDSPATIIVLDADTEGASPENVFEIFNQQRNVTQFRLQDSALDGQDGIAPEYVRDVMADLDAVAAPAPYLTGTWEHIFLGTQPSNVRLVFDSASSKIIAMQHISGSGTFSLASAEEIADVLDSILNANPEALTQPEEFGLTAVATLPQWACGTSDNPIVQLFVREMALARTRFGLLVSQLVGALQLHPDQAHVELLEWAIIGEAREYLLNVVGKGAGPNPADQYLAVQNADSWVTQQMVGIEAAVIAHIALNGANETMERVHAITRPDEEGEECAP